ncbi:MAG TPA: hypothetical protein PKN04_11220 [bacterium]|jgi:hypothetical protein|nr:hypothetical protein [bacterium]HNT66341.1 hypothetical protein [bacterium]HOX87266.1 hypothetical protein [bacterium]HPG46727.1 hypothetical protein [bacterium]HPM98741.1 hypothetical protein [bacterium]
MASDKKTAPDKTAELHKQLLADLGNLRGEFRDLINRYQSETETRLVRCINILSDANYAEKNRVMKNSKKLNRLVDLFAKLKIDPLQDSFKELKRIDRGVDQIFAILEKK